MVVMFMSFIVDLTCSHFTPFLWSLFRVVTYSSQYSVRGYPEVRVFYWPIQGALNPKRCLDGQLQMLPSAAFTPPAAATSLAYLAAVSDLSADQSQSVPCVWGIGSRSSMTQGCEDTEWLENGKPLETGRKRTEPQHCDLQDIMN